jgi:hypothetical protein
VTLHHLVRAASISLWAAIRPRRLVPASLVTRVRNLTVAKVDSIGFTMRRCTQQAAGIRRTSTTPPYPRPARPRPMGHSSEKTPAI